MANNSNFLNELKALGNELRKAVGEARQSKEFKELERELVSSVKSVTAEVRKSLNAAQRSQAAGRIKNRFGRVVKAGKVSGAAQAKKARAEAMKRFAKAKQAIRALRKKHTK